MYLYLLEYTALKDYREDHKKQRELANRLLGFALKKHYGVDLDSLRVGIGLWGKPYFSDSDIYFSKSHTKGMVAVGIGKNELGVDCQAVKPVTRALIRRCCSDAELERVSSYRDFALVWAKKEALVKMSGRGIGGSIKDIDSSVVPFGFTAESFAAAAVSKAGESIVLTLLSEKDI